MRRNFGKIVKICTCILARLNFTFQTHTFHNGAGARVQVRKHCERIPRLLHYRDTVVRETLLCVAESSNSSDRFAVAKI